jgi:transposase
MERHVASDAGEGVRIYLALELSRSSWLATRRLLTKLADTSLPPGMSPGPDRASRVEHQTGQLVQVISCYEAGYDGFWLDRKLKAQSVINHVMDPASIQVNRRARRVNAVDAEALLRALFCRGEKKVCSMVRVPTREEESALVGNASS